MDGSFYAEGKTLWRRPLRKGDAVSLGFLVATFEDDVNAETAAHILNTNDQTLAALKQITAAVKSAGNWYGTLPAALDVADDAIAMAEPTP